jgi:hypothetical protein
MPPTHFTTVVLSTYGYVRGVQFRGALVGSLCWRLYGWMLVGVRRHLSTRVAYTCGGFGGSDGGREQHPTWSLPLRVHPQMCCAPPDKFGVRCEDEPATAGPAEAGGEVPGVCRMIWRGLCRNCHQVGSRPSVTHLHPLHHETLEFDPVEVSWCPKRVGISLQEVIWWV